MHLPVWMGCHQTAKVLSMHASDIDFSIILKWVTGVAVFVQYFYNTKLIMLNYTEPKPALLFLVPGFCNGIPSCEKGILPLLPLTDVNREMLEAG